MKAKLDFKLLIRPAVYTLVVNFCACALFVLHTERVIDDSAYLLLTIVVLAIAAPIYFFIKPRRGTWWLQGALTVAFHLVIGCTYLQIVGHLDLGWTFLAAVWQEWIVTAFFVCVVGLDLLIAGVGHFRKKPKGV